MLLLSHPTGNAFVRAVLAAVEQAGELESFYTTVMVEESAWYIRLLPQSLKKELLRRTYNLTKSKISTRTLEDWDLSVRIADADWGNVYTPQVLASYRVWTDAGQMRL